MKAVSKSTYKELHVGLPVMLNGMKTRRPCTGIYSRATPIHNYNYPSSNPTPLFFCEPPINEVISRPIIFFLSIGIDNGMKTRQLCACIYSKATSIYIYNYPISTLTLLFSLNHCPLTKIG